METTNINGQDYPGSLEDGWKKGFKFLTNWNLTFVESNLNLV